MTVRLRARQRDESTAVLIAQGDTESPEFDPCGRALLAGIFQSMKRMETVVAGQPVVLVFKLGGLAPVIGLAVLMAAAGIYLKLRRRFVRVTR